MEKIVQNTAIKKQATTRIVSKKPEITKLQGELPLPEPRESSSQASYVARLRTQALGANDIREVLEKVLENPVDTKSLEMMRALKENRAIRHPVWLIYSLPDNYRLPEQLDRTWRDEPYMQSLSDSQKKVYLEIRNIYYGEFMNHASGS